MLRRAIFLCIVALLLYAGAIVCVVLSPALCLLRWTRGLKNGWISHSQAINCIFGGGDPDETLSSRAGKAQWSADMAGVPLAWHWRVIDWLTMQVEPEHIRKAIEADEGGDAAGWMPR